MYWNYIELVVYFNAHKTHTRTEKSLDMEASFNSWTETKQALSQRLLHIFSYHHDLNIRETSRDSLYPSLLIGIEIFSKKCPLATFLIRSLNIVVPYFGFLGSQKMESEIYSLQCIQDKEKFLDVGKI